MKERDFCSELAYTIFPEKTFLKYHVNIQFMPHCDPSLSAAKL